MNALEIPMEETNPPTAGPSLELEPRDSWEVLFSQVELIKELGHGAFGKVWKGVLTTSETVEAAADKKGTSKEKAPKIIQKKTTVAVKMLRGKFLQDASLL